MASGLAVIASELLSMRCYIEHNVTGVLIQPGHEGELTQALATLLAYPDHRRELGEAARRWAVQHVDLARTVDQLEALLQSGTRQGRWQRGVEALRTRRSGYDPARLQRYAEITTECLAFFDLEGDVLDVGCGDGRLGRHLNGKVRSYVGIDVTPNPNVQVGDAEALPVRDASVDTVLSYSVLQHVMNPAQALAEAWRVLRPGGRLALQCSVADANPLFLFWWEAEDVVALVEQAGFRIEAFQQIRDRLLVVNAMKPH